jgi:hypothetical protein
MKQNKFIVLLLVVFTLIGCKDYYNDSIHWMDNLESEMNIKDVQNEQPDYIEIDWEYPLIVDDQKWYLISKIKGNNDILGMSHYLVFIENKYQYRESKK